jgi:hypothetical protein
MLLQLVEEKEAVKGKGIDKEKPKKEGNSKIECTFIHDISQ